MVFNKYRDTRYYRDYHLAIVRSLKHLLYAVMYILLEAVASSRYLEAIFTRDSIYAIARICHANSVCPSVRPSVRPSHACIVSKRLNVSSKFFHDRPIILVFRHQGSLRSLNLRASPPTGREIEGGSDFRPICDYISETVRDRGIVTMKDEFKVVCALSNGATFDDLE